ncbi:MAG: mannose-6-phosphate isomerase, class I [Cellulomonas sp. 73-145]|uniref:mannose-6-phosphate isomerase, class I n=1 Tax=Cellulomonas sp. 73-145 TaxID=1895739 RepID=UPI00092B6F19|nr:mannose-6-phosphate isomerase, class I [Cellulomonas sp. 73-145]MBN9327268.1 mannose-6-phosphate isomerase, class I [Cellulomonas sp.]OJV59918.1 MAG: mannose-6-phosphate isomerase, class I [Cellulomonas sp. 73-145]
MLRITQATQAYAWGSPDALQDTLALTHDGVLAEAWMGAHPSAPSLVLDDGLENLVELLRRTPREALGLDVVNRFGPQLPYLLKVIAAEHPLSLQVHPDIDAARAGYDAEDAAGVPLDAPHRNYKDRNHKPELVYALTQFEAMCGFRAPRRAAEMFAGLDCPLAKELHGVLVEKPSTEGIREAFTRLLDPATRPGPEEVARLADAVAARLADGSPSPRTDRTVGLLQREYPGDPGVVTSMLLNPVTLRPGEAMFVPAGGVHAYLQGVGVEIMASSDNVLRAGLTPKHVDVPELLRNVDYVAAPPIRIAPEVFHGATKVFYAPVDDFELSVTELADDDDHPLPGRGPRILLALAGELTVATSNDGTVTLTQGQAAFVPASDGRLTVRGRGRLVQADVP